MSFSFNIRAKSKSEAIMKVDDGLANVVASQPIHGMDRVKAQAVAEAYINLVDDPGEGDALSVSVSGSLGTATARTVSVTINVGVFLIPASLTE